jgi:hypothetical protein
MNEFEQTSPGPAGSGIAELQDELRSLRALLSASLALVIVFSIVIDFFLLKQISTLRAQTEVLEAASNTLNTPKAIDYWNHLTAYARTHPDFAPVINKFSPAIGQTFLGNNVARQ